MIAALAVAAAMAAPAAAAASEPKVQLFGAGASESCAAWLSTPANEAEGFAWIVGFWSGLNGGHAEANGQTNVGHTTDGWGIVGEVKKLCENSPSSTPMAEALRLYGQFARDGR